MGEIYHRTWMLNLLRVRWPRFLFPCECSSPPGWTNEFTCLQFPWRLPRLTVRLHPAFNRKVSPAVVGDASVTDIISRPAFAASPSANFSEFCCIILTLECSYMVNDEEAIKWSQLWCQFALQSSHSVGLSLRVKRQHPLLTQSECSGLKPRAYTV